MSFEVRSFDKVDAIGDGGHDCGQAFPDGFGLSGQVNDQCFSANAGGLAAENGCGNFFEGDFSHQFTEAGEDFIADIECCFGGYIAYSRTGSSGCDD